MSTRSLLSSPRRRRRLAWTVPPLVLVAVAIGVAVVFSDSKRLPPDELRPGAAVPREEREVALTSATRRAINDVLDEFVPAAVGRRDPARAWELAGSGLRAGSTRSEWLAGNMPVHPYPFADLPFRAWRKVYAYPNKVAIDLLLHPRPGARLGPIVFGVDLVRRGDRWRVDSIYPAAVFSGPAQPGDGRASGERAAAGDLPRGDKARLDPIWLLVPGLVFGSALLIPLAFGIRALAGRRRSRRRDALPWLSSSADRRPNEPN